MKNVLVVGSNGQDGRIISSLLTSSGYNLLFLTRKDLIYEGKILKNDFIPNKLFFKRILKEYSPSLIFYFATSHKSSSDNKGLNDLNYLSDTWNNNTTIYHELLISIIESKIKPKILYASSRLVFDQKLIGKVNEKSSMVPDEAYGISKLASMNIGNYYSKNYGLKIFNAIYFNHDSEYRKKNFLLPQLILSAKKSIKNKNFKFEINNLDAKIDISSAWDMMKMSIMLINSKAPPGDYVFGSGRQYFLKDIVSIIFDYFDLDYKNHIQISENTMQRTTFNYFSDTDKLAASIGYFDLDGPNIWLPKMIKKF